MFSGSGSEPMRNEAEVGVEQQALTQGLDRRLLWRRLLPFPQHQHRQVLRVGQAELIEHRLVGTDHSPGSGVQLEAQLTVKLQGID